MRHRALGWCCLLLCLAVVATPRAHARTVVVFYETDWRTPTNIAIDQGLRDELEVNEAGSDVKYYSEFLDNARFSSPAQDQRHADFLRDRYSDIKVDVLIALDPLSLQFLMRHRDKVFPGAPVAFTRIRDTTLARLKPPADFVGTPFRLDARPTVELALRLWPQAKELVIITGTTEIDRAWEQFLRAACAAAAPALKTRVLTGLPIDDIVREVSALPREAVILTGPFRRDGAGQVFPNAITLLERLRPVTPVPILHVLENGVGKGALGSVSVPLESVSRQVAAVAKQLLAGVEPASVVLPEQAKQVTLVDWRELKRWGIPESRLPPDAVVRFREPTFWDQYRYHSLGIASVILLQSALLTLLLLQRRRRERMEAMLRQNEASMKLAAEAADLAAWSWDIRADVVDRLSPPGHVLTRAHAGGGLAAFLDVIHAEDREQVERAIRRSMHGDGHYEAEYRVADRDGKVRWFAGRGRVEYVNGKPHRLRGVTLDITTRKAAELEVLHRRNELAHLSRVTMVGELSVSMAHELNQPLMAILSNAQAARMFIRHEPVDMVELGSILDDIVENDKRAGQIIWGLRKMLKKEAAAHEILGVNELVQEVLRLMRNDLVNRQITIESRLAPGAPTVRGDHTQLQQVVVNLLLNACDAMESLPRAERILRVSVELEGSEVRVRVADRGAGIAEGCMDEIFMPFYTTKAQGLGLGLAVSKSIIASHGGVLRAENNRDCGATFTLVLGAEKTRAFA